METPKPDSARHFEQRSEFHGAIFECLDRARHEVMMFDPGFETWPANEARFTEALARFLRHSQRARLRLLANSPVHLLRNCPRLITLLSRHSGQVQCLHPAEPKPGLVESLLIADRLHALRVPVASRLRGVVRLGDAAYAHQLADRFDEISHLCDSRIVVSPLGI